MTKLLSVTAIVERFGKMKKIISILFLLIFLLAHTELHEFLGLPTLIEHYLEHQQEDNTQTFWSFLLQHYAYTHHTRDNSHHQHEKLPFKTNHSTVGILLAFFADFNFQIPFLAIFQEKIYSLYHPQAYISLLQNSIWQPPKNE